MEPRGRWSGKRVALELELERGRGRSQVRREGKSRRLRQGSRRLGVT